MWQYNYTDELYHYGVPGMKWGYRRGRSSTVAARGEASKYLKKDFYKVSKEEAKQFKKDAKQVTKYGYLSDKRHGEVKKKYEEAVMEKARKDRLVSTIATATIAAGVAFANRKQIKKALPKMVEAGKKFLGFD